MYIVMILTKYIPGFKDEFTKEFEKMNGIYVDNIYNLDENALDSYKLALLGLFLNNSD